MGRGEKIELKGNCKFDLSSRSSKSCFIITACLVLSYPKFVLGTRSIFLSKMSGFRYTRTKLMFFSIEKLTLFMFLV